MIVIGAGMAGLISACILRDDCEQIIEAQESLPANHSAVLRFRSTVIGDATNVPLKKIQMVKSYQTWRNPIADAMAYSRKTNGGFQLRSIITADGKPQDRYVAPPNFTEILSKKVHCPISWGSKLDRQLVKHFQSEEIPVISTLPMPILMSLLEYKDYDKSWFGSASGINITATINNCDMYCSLYVPSPLIGPYRISINGDQLIIETALLDSELSEKARTIKKGRTSDSILNIKTERWLDDSLQLLGLTRSDISEVSISFQRYAKMLPIPEDARRKFILWASDNFGIYSLGRYATWRPNLLLDDVINDVRMVSNLISKGHYDQRKEMAQ